MPDLRSPLRAVETFLAASAVVLLPHGEDDAPTFRPLGFVVALGTSLLVIGLLFACYVQGALPEGAFVRVTAAVVAAMIGFYLVFRAGLNRAAADRSLTLHQMVVATLVVMYAMYSADAGGAGVFPIIVVMIFLFGVLRLRTRALLLFALFILAAHTATIALRAYTMPEVQDVGARLLQWVALAVTLPWFALMGGYIKGLREELGKSNTLLRAALQDAQASESRLAEAQRIAGLGSWTFDPATKVTHWSPEMYRIFGADSAHGVPAGGEFLRRVHPADQRHYLDLIRPARDEGRSFDSEYRIVSPEGELRWVHVVGEPVVDDHGQTILLRGTVVDFTERRQLEDRQAMEHAVTRLLAESEALAETMPKVIRTVCETLGWDCGARWQPDAKDHMLHCADTWSPADAAIAEFNAYNTGQTYAPSASGLICRAMATGEPIWIADVAREPGFKRAAVAQRAGLHGAFAFPIRVRSEILGAMEFYTRNVRQPDTALLRVLDSIGLQIGQFIARATVQEQLKRLAHYDFLTGLPNRHLFNELLAHAFAKAKRNGTRLAILFVDLDGFKQVNDRYGHDAGDHLLATFTLRLKGCLRESDTFARHGLSDTAARLGGDEFVVLVDDVVEPSDLGVLAKRILRVAATPFDLAGPQGHVSASIGIGIYPQDGEDVDGLIKAADSAMYDAKKSGRNTYRYFSATTRQHACVVS